MQHKVQVKLVKAIVTELTPGKHYLIGLDNNMVTMENASAVAKGVYEITGQRGFVVVFNGDPTKGLQIIELPEESK